MKTYHDISDFLEDKSFRDWVLNDDPVHRMIWEKWQMDRPEKKDILLQAKTILLELDPPGKGWNEERKKLVFTRIADQIQLDSKKPVPVYYTHSSGIEKLSRAAIVSFLLVVAIVAFLTVHKPQENRGVAQEEKQEWVIKSNPRGQKSTIHLPDGSTVFLNSESEIQFNRGFGKDRRDIVLKGEGFFEVAPDSLVPFRVFSGQLVTVALGTSFNINAHGHEKEQVRLATGAVKVYLENEADQAYCLKPGEEILLGADEAITQGKFDPNKAFLWKSGILLFDQTPFPEVIQILERWYAVNIEVKNIPEAGKNISGEFKNIYLSDLLESLGYAYGFSYQVNNKEVIIKFK